ncbi:SDR family oxidoreductase [Streptomyces sp. NRRL WC-3742]|nr:SDR family oxidoreductase [Streptomyces sp. NRRL WC-3742]
MPDRTALRHFGRLRDVADVGGFLVSEHASYIPGQVFQVDGGPGP